MDYSGMKATKTKKQKLDTDITISRKTTNSAKRTLKRAGISWIVVILCLVIGLAGGYFGAKLAFSKDTYQMQTYASGEADVYIGKDETYQTYTELGVKCIAFGKDISKECSVTYFYRSDLTDDATKVDKVDETVPGMYYAVYNCKNIRFSSVKLIRNIIVLKEEDNG